MAFNLRLIPLLPFLGAALLLLFGRRWKRDTVVTIAAGAILASCFVAVDAFFTRLPEAAEAGGLTDVVWSWITTGSGANALNVELAFRMDGLSGLLCLIITFIGFLIHVYSAGYMEHEADYARFFGYLNLFCGAMLVLVLGDSLPVMFVGWEGVGLCSYLLIGFWYTEDANASAGKKAFITNRIGDFGFLLGMFLLFQFTGTMNFSEITASAVGPGSPLAQPYLLGQPVAFWVGVLLFVGACGKSAQIPLYTWLPDAMEGPTPVSALIHAATMVTAGVYMVARNYPLFIHTPATLLVVAIVGGLTAIFAASIGLVQNDIKRILAYSTVSQLGYMFLALGVVVPISGIFHLFTHAFFKGCLFLCAGSVIHGMEHAFEHAHVHDKDPQDIRNMGGLRRYMPWTAWTFLLACLAISGIFPFAGFWSKDEILTGAFTNGYFILYAVGLITAAMTAFYMFREYFVVFEGESRFDHHEVHPHESVWWMAGPLVVLAFFSVVIGAAVGAPPEHGLFRNFLDPVFAPVLGQERGETAFVETLILIGVSLLVAVIGIWVAFMMYKRRAWSPERLAARFPRTYDLLYHKWYVDEIYNAGIVQPTLGFARFLWSFDAGVIDGIVNGLGYLTRGMGRGLRPIQSGVVGNYALGMTIGLLAIVGSFLLKGLIVG